MSNINFSLLDDLLNCQKSLLRSQALLKMADSISQDFLINGNQSTSHNLYKAIRDIVLASRHLNSSALEDLDCSLFLLKSSIDAGQPTKRMDARACLEQACSWKNVNGILLPQY